MRMLVHYGAYHTQLIFFLSFNGEGIMQYETARSYLNLQKVLWNKCQHGLISKEYILNCQQKKKDKLSHKNTKIFIIISRNLV